MSERQRSAKAPAKQDSLKGQAFHSLYPDGRANYQGEFVKDLGGGLYLVQYYSWWDGGPTNQEILPVTEFARRHPDGKPVYALYATMDDAEYAYQHGMNNLRDHSKDSFFRDET